MLKVKKFLFHEKSEPDFFPTRFSVILSNLVTVQSQAKFHKTGGKYLHFNRINCEAVIRL